MSELPTTVAVIDAIGGTAAVAALTGRTYNAAHNWRSFGRFPANTYLVLNDELAQRGLTAPARLWGMVDAEGASA